MELLWCPPFGFACSKHVKDEQPTSFFLGSTPLASLIFRALVPLSRAPCVQDSVAFFSRSVSQMSD